MANPGLNCLRVILLSTVLFSAACQTSPRVVETPKATAKVFPAAKRYAKAVEDRLGPIWYERVRRNENGAALGTVVATFRIAANGGRPRNVQINSNTGNQVDELIVREALWLLRAPPIPPELLAELPDREFVLEESFTIFDNAAPNPSVSTSLRR